MSLRPDAKHLIESARDGVTPSRAARNRVRAALAAKAGAAALVATTGAAGAGATVSTGAAVGSSVLLKLGAAVVLLGGGALGARYVATHASSALEAPVTASTVIPRPSVAQPSPIASALRSTAQAADDAVAVATGEPTPAKEAPAPALGPAASVRSIAPVKSGSPVAASFRTTLAAETELLRRAHEARVAGQTAAALSTLSRYESRFPRGILAGEAAAERVLALCAAGRTAEARALGQSIVTTASRSTLHAVVENSCAASGRKIDSPAR